MTTPETVRALAAREAAEEQHRAVETSGAAIVSATEELKRLTASLSFSHSSWVPAPRNTATNPPATHRSGS